MSITYIVKTGDTLTSIAKKFNRPSWQELYNHPENAEFRRKRPNPNRIFTGDAIQIPTAADPPIPPPPRPAPAPPKPKESKVNQKSVYLPETTAKMADDKGGDAYYLARFAKIVAEPDTAVVEHGRASVDADTLVSRIDIVRRQDAGSKLSMSTIDHYDFTFSFAPASKDDVMIFQGGTLKERVSSQVAQEIYAHPGHYILRPRKPGTSGWQ